MSWNDAFNDPQQDLFKDIDPMSGVSYPAGSNSVSISSFDPAWTTYNAVGDIGISSIDYNSLNNTLSRENVYISVGKERLDERMLKRWRIFWDLMESDPRFAGVIQDIETQIAFEKLGEDNDK